MTTEAIESAVGAEVVFVPADVANTSNTAQLQLRHMEDGRLAILAYTSLELLVAGCGSAQPWVAVPVGELETLKPMAGFDVIALDVDLPPDWRVADDDGEAAEAAR